MIRWTNAGEFVAPEKLECIYQECVVVDQVFVYGTPLKEYLTAVVVRLQPNPLLRHNNARGGCKQFSFVLRAWAQVPNFPLVRAWAQSKADASLDAALDDLPALCAHPAVKRFATHTHALRMTDTHTEAMLTWQLQ